MSHRHEQSSERAPRWSAAVSIAVALLCFVIFGDAAPSGAGVQVTRTFPPTAGGVVVFSDQLDTASMTEALFKFAATHYAGAQKLLPPDARHLRRYNSNFIVLHYRLGQGLGYKSPDAHCRLTGSYLQIIDGNWVQEWPGSKVVKPEWFFPWSGKTRVYNCNFGWYLMELNDASWRQWWSGQVVQQLTTNQDDGVFADSYSIPNYGFTWKPSLPGVDATFEAAWAKREHAFTDYMRSTFAGRWKWIPNIGSYITSRDPSDYSNVDGAMIEQFAEYGCHNYLATGDWQLQMNRVLPLVSADKDILAQTYPCGNDVYERLFDLGTYLLVKGNHTYVNLTSYGLSVQWLPEYGVNLGGAVDPLPSNISSYYNSAWRVYVRHYANGLALVNPSTSGSGTFDLGATYYNVVPIGGGVVPPNGVPSGSLSYVATRSFSVCANCGAILLTNAPRPRPPARRRVASRS
jgi:hypothetical protein